MRLIVRRYVEDAYFEGMLQNDASPDQLSEDDRERIDELIATQDQYVAKFAQDVRDARGDAVQQNSIRLRIDAWTRSIEKSGNLGTIAAARTRKEQRQWHTRGRGVEGVCELCASLNNKVVKAGESFGEDSQGKPVYCAPAHDHCYCQDMEYVD